MRGHFLLKWLFLTVLSVSALHFREAGLTGHYQIEQTGRPQNSATRKVFHFRYSQPYTNQSAHFAHFKQAQSARISCLSIKLSNAVAHHATFNFHPTPDQAQVQNQHFRSRTLAPDDHSISQS